MIFKRKIYDKLLEWKKRSNGESAMLIEGARRIGKSTIVEEFGKNEYKSYILINFSNAPKIIKETFENDLINLDKLFMIISAEYDTKLYTRNSLIIFDEVQKFPRAREAIKHLVKDGRYDYIETGSLISIKENVINIVIPSEEESIKMYPLDFEEFAWALGENLIIDYIKKCFKEEIPLYDAIHKKSMFLFKEYLLIGGMPKVVSLYLENKKQFDKCEREKKLILKNYREDIKKIDKNYQSKVLSIFDQIPSFLSQHEKRVKISQLINDKKSINYDETFFWLSDSMICNECFMTTDPNFGLSLNEKRNFIKCYMGDTGLLITHTFDENNDLNTNFYSEILKDKLSINQGMFYENLISQMLVSNGHKLYYYSSKSKINHRNEIEIDFLLTTGNKVNTKLIPIEVKSSKSYKTNSLELFIKKFKNRINKSYIIHPKNFSKKENGIICIPPYMTFLL